MKHNTMKRLTASVMALLITAGNLSVNAGLLTGTNLIAAAEETAELHAQKETAAPAEKAARTIMLYTCGADLETKPGMASFNLRQVLNADFGEDVNFIVMTGGSMKWHLESEYLYDPATDAAPDTISTEYNQIWEAKGIHAKENAGKMVLLDGDGISGDGENAKKSEDELMTDPETLKSFIDYTAENFPAEQYDLILWDHGGGPIMGFGKDEHGKGQGMSFDGLLDAFSDNAVTRNGGKFDFIDFDACEMSSLDLALAFADYADYYIASPETEPGYGQYYTGWLDMLGKTPDADTYTLGKKIVDDFITFYESEDSKGYGQKGTLSVIDTKKLVESDMVSALSEFVTILHNELTQPDADGEYQFYDELFSAARALQYGSMSAYVDLGNLMQFISIRTKELKAEHVDGENIDTMTTNAYLEAAQRVLAVLEDPDVLYARGTANLSTGEPDVYRQSDGTLEFDRLGTSGIYLPTFHGSTMPLDAAFAKMPDDERSRFLKDCLDVMTEYYLVVQAGNAVGALKDSGVADSEITYDAVKAHWAEMGNDTSLNCADRLPGGETAVREMLEPIIRQQVKEAVTKENVSVDVVNGATANRYIVNIDNTKKRMIDNVTLRYVAELPAAEAYFNTFDNPALKEFVKLFGGELCLGSHDAEYRIDDSLLDAEDLYKSYIDWYNQPSGSWEVSGIEDKWYAISDAEGTLHVAQAMMDGNNTNEIASFAYYESEGTQHLVGLAFENNKLTYLMLFSEDMDSSKAVPVEELTEPLELMPALLVDLFGIKRVFIPISKSTFTLSADNADKIQMVYTDVENITDIEDIDGDGSALKAELVVKDIYDYRTNISDKMEEPVQSYSNIEDAVVKPTLYDGTAQRPVVMLGDKVLEEGVDYTIVNLSDSETFTEIGSYLITIIGKGAYTEAITTCFEILPAKDFASPEVLANMAKIDYEKKHGVAVMPEIVANEDYILTVALKNTAGEVLDTYQINVKTGIGADTADEEVNLPQTGVTTKMPAASVVGALMMLLSGAWLAGRSFRKRDEN